VNQVSSKLINHCRAFPFLVLSIFFSCFLPHQLPSSCTALYTLSLPPPSLALVAFNKNRTASFQIDYDSVQSPLQKAARIIISRDSTRTFVMLKRPPNKPKINRYRNRKPKIMLKFTEWLLQWHKQITCDYSKKPNQNHTVIELTCPSPVLIINSTFCNISKQYIMT